MAEAESQTDPVEMAAELTMAWLSNPNTRVEASDVGNVLRQFHEAVAGLANSSAPEASEPAQEFTPAVSVRKSLSSKDHIISLIDGKPYKSLRRHLSSQGLTPDQYRERYGLRKDYPMVSESYSQVRRDMAKTIGLGRKPKDTPKPSEAPDAAKPRGRGRPKKAAAGSAPEQQPTSAAVEA
jgi:predicted transcriptional regulator